MPTAKTDLIKETFFSILKNYPPGISAQLVVHHQGTRIVDLHGRAYQTPDNSPETAYLTFSVSKGFTTCAILKLIDDGLIELDAPVATYWPEFGQRGKETATIRHTLVHQAGIPAPHLYQQLILWPFWNLVTRRVASYPAEFPPGSQTAYHMVNFGFILGEVVRRVTGMPIDRYLQQQFFKPMGLKRIWMRAPGKEESDSPRVVALSRSMKNTATLFNLHTIRRALIPAAGLHSNADCLAEFFSMLLNAGVYQGHQYLRPETIAEAASSQYNGLDNYVQTQMNWGLGFIMGGGMSANSDPTRNAMGTGSSSTSFGSFGMGTCMVWVDRDAQLVTAFTTNGMLSGSKSNERWAMISNAIWKAIS